MVIVILDNSGTHVLYMVCKQINTRCAKWYKQIEIYIVYTYYSLVYLIYPLIVAHTDSHTNIHNVAHLFDIKRKGDTVGHDLLYFSTLTH